MPDLTRVRLDNGAETTVGAEFARARGLRELDESPTRPDGSLRPTTRNGGRRKKPKTTVAKSAADKKASTEPAAMAEEATE